MFVAWTAKVPVTENLGIIAAFWLDGRPASYQLQAWITPFILALIMYKQFRVHVTYSSKYTVSLDL